MTPGDEVPVMSQLFRQTFDIIHDKRQHINVDVVGGREKNGPGHTISPELDWAERCHWPISPNYRFFALTKSGVVEIQRFSIEFQRLFQVQLVFKMLGNLLEFVWLLEHLVL
eukprot:Lithocolla_globosa_v1_NODE_6216_length_1121_cov_10.208255.p2 type:complete len:112 gc:universal NODE_6216_length_1121_cov_10.208255:587-922(+)